MLKVVFFLRGVRCRQIAKKKTPSSADPFHFPLFFFFFWKAEGKREALFTAANPLFSGTWQRATRKESGNWQQAAFNAHLHRPVGSLQSPAQMSAFPSARAALPPAPPAPERKDWEVSKHCSQPKPPFVFTAALSYKRTLK